MIGDFEFCHNLDMNYRKFTNESDFYSQKDALSCDYAIFSFQMTKKNKLKKKQFDLEDIFSTI